MRHVVCISGGYDSTCMALLLSEKNNQEYEFITHPTGNELPKMVEHLKRLPHLLGQPVVEVGYGKDLEGVIDEQKMIPNWRARFCARLLKIVPVIEYMNAAKPATMYVGLRADEPERCGLYGDMWPVRFPLREAGFAKQDVWDYLYRREIKIPARTDCAWCYYQRLGQWWMLWKEHPELYARAEAKEHKYGHTFRSEQRDLWPASLEQLRVRFEQGHIPMGAEVNYNLFESAEKPGCRLCTL